MEVQMETSPTPPGKVMICRPYITVKGKRIYASQYGKAAFCFLVDAEKGESK
jgi:hypothetical protein